MHVRSIELLSRLQWESIPHATHQEMLMLGKFGNCFVTAAAVVVATPAVLGSGSLCWTGVIASN